MWNSRIEAVRKGGMKSISTAVMERWFSATYRANFPEVVATIKLILERQDPDGYIASCAAVRDFDARETIAKMAVPTLVIAGTHDAATTPSDGHYLADRIAGAQYVELNAAHLSNIEDPGHFTSRSSSFLLSQ
jgi:3-oxoadipate enol-lactonase